MIDFGVVVAGDEHWIDGRFGAWAFLGGVVGYNGIGAT